MHAISLSLTPHRHDYSDLHYNGYYDNDDGTRGFNYHQGPVSCDELVHLTMSTLYTLYTLYSVYIVYIVYTIYY